MHRNILEKYYHYLRQKYRKNRTIYANYEFTKLFLQWINKPAKRITKKDVNRWKEYITQRYKPNGNIRRISSVNNFLTWLGKEKLRLPYPKPEECNKKILSDTEINNYIEASKEDPLLHLIALM